MSDGVCSRCGPKRERKRTKEERPHNNRRWQKHSKVYRSENPFCVDCLAEGRTTLATQVHHVAKAREHEDAMYDDENLMALCDRHHAIRTRKGE